MIVSFLRRHDTRSAANSPGGLREKLRPRGAPPILDGSGVPPCKGRLVVINTLIVDDEKPARDELAYFLKGFPEINVIAQGKNGVEAVALIKEHAPDLVFLDVKMPGLDGFGVLKKVVERKIRLPHVVFATAFDHYAVQA